jgi:ABC-2 type transport system permease protein
MVSTRRIMADLRIYGLGYMRDRAGFMNLLIAPVVMIIAFGVILSYMPSLSGGSSAMTVWAPGLISIATTLLPMESLTATSSNYKKTKLFKQLSLTPITRVEWLSSKVLWFIIITGVAFVLSLATAVIAFGAKVTLTLWVIPFLVLGSIFFTSLSMLIGTAAKNTETSNMVSYIVMLPMLLLAGGFFPVALMPTYLQDFAHVLPQFYVVEGLNAVMVHGDYTQAISDVAILAVLAIIMFVLAARLSKWRED